jgi:hypothetical protein
MVMRGKTVDAAARQRAGMTAGFVNALEHYRP